jgi:8-oxo-dGTP pyrophosphatase MutT (NUDIX family)
MRRHASQISLPGGRVEPGETIERAALREAHEETGLDPAAIRVLGRLTPLYIPVSGFVLHPVVAVTPRRPALAPDQREVDRVIEMPIADLADARRVRRGVRTRDGQRVEYGYFVADSNDEVWGATAMVLAEFLWLLGVRHDPWAD